MNKKDAKTRLIRWVLLLQEFNLHIVHRKDEDNLVGVHLSRMETNPVDSIPIDDSFRNEKFAIVKGKSPWLADYTNFITAKFMPPQFTLQ
jgi:hypothetical protein